MFKCKEAQCETTQHWCKGYCKRHFMRYYQRIRSGAGYWDANNNYVALRSSKLGRPGANWNQPEFDTIDTSDMAK